MATKRMVYTVFRKAVLPEDEGRMHFIRSFDTETAAEAFVAKQEGEYFRPGDYTIGVSVI